MTVLTRKEGDRIGLSPRQVMIVNMVDQRYSRQAIAKALGVSEQSARDLIGGLCDHYQCPTADLANRVRDDLASRAGTEA